MTLIFLKIKKIRKYYLSIGRLVDQKNFQLLIDAFEIVNNNYDVKLIILGEGYLELELKKIVKKKIR